MGVQLETLRNTCCTTVPKSQLDSYEVTTENYQIKPETKEIQSSQGTSQTDGNETAASANMKTLVQPDGSTYTGEIRNDMKHGHGV